MCSLVWHSTDTSIDGFHRCLVATWCSSDTWNAHLLIVLKEPGQQSSSGVGHEQGVGLLYHIAGRPYLIQEYASCMPKMVMRCILRKSLPSDLSQAVLGQL